MKPFILSSLLALSFSAAQAIPTPQPYTVELVNTGTDNLYYALSQNVSDYSSTLSIQINGMQDKNDVVGEINPGEPQKLVFVPRTDFYKFMLAPYGFYHFTFAHSLTSAQAALNVPSILVQFNTMVMVGPYNWDIKGSSNTIICEATLSQLSECDIDSNSIQFKY